ncbi:MAG: hypothetical protein B6I26_06590 [Desulfobacteraceae bacterium 4572_130]|nr:MAG: hypothetical protein B6I26_06590 [Desulfobacteraceae bacterium 4572_130]
MPGFNQKGPSNQGPMTGRKMGKCVNNENLTEFTETQTSYNMGLGLRRCRGRNLRQGFGMGRQRNSQTDFNQKTNLKQRAEILESELNAIKQELINS